MENINNIYLKCNNKNVIWNIKLFNSIWLNEENVFSSIQTRSVIKLWMHLLTAIQNNAYVLCSFSDDSNGCN